MAEAVTNAGTSPDWIERLRRASRRPGGEDQYGLRRNRSLDKDAITALWPLLCDVVEAGEACVDGIIPLAGSKTEHFVLSLAALRAEVERDG